MHQQVFLKQKKHQKELPVKVFLNKKLNLIKSWSLKDSVAV